jgi:phosphoglycolate phosphatase
MTLRGIVFDLDSTLVDSHVDFVKMKQNIIRYLEQNGHPPNTLSPTSMTTVKISEEAEKNWAKQGKTEKQKQRMRDKITEYMDQGELEAVETLTEVPGARQAVEQLQAKGYKLAVLTRSHHLYADKALEKTGMTRYFGVVLGRGETPQPKPYREALEHTAEHMGLTIDEIIMIGDHQIDCDSATSCGCKFIGVSTGHRGLKSWANETPPAVLLDSVAQLPAYLEANCA